MPIKIAFSRQRPPGGEVVIVTLSGRFASKETEEFIKETDSYMEETQTNRLILDLGRLEYAGSQAAAALVQLAARYQVKIADVPPAIQSVFSILGLDQLFEIYPNVEAALTKF